MTYGWRNGCLALAVAAAVVPAAWGQTTSPMLESQLSSNKIAPDGGKPEPTLEETINQIKHPFQGFTWGADQRIRHEYLNNHYPLNQQIHGHEYDYERERTRIWASYSPCEFIELNARLAWEWRQWENTPPGKVSNDWSHVTTDIFNFKIKMPQINSSLTVGRQEIFLGDGWLVADGTPLDGSTTLYFDAARFNMNAKDIQTTFDAIYINQYADNDKWLPTINDDDKQQMEQDEKGVVLYASNKSLQDTTIDGYLIYKHDKAVLPYIVPGSHGGNSADMYTVGSRAEHLFDEHWKGRIEGAYQFGDKNSLPLSAWGTIGRLTYMFNDVYKNQLFLNGEALSGRRTGAGTDQMFDPLWGRWPQWSELYVYTYRPETRVGETTNLMRLGPGYQITPAKNLTFTTTYNALWAMQTPQANTTNGGMKFGDGNFRGHLFTGNVKYKFNSHLAGHLWAEYFLPGTYYAQPSNDGAVFLRAEMVLTF